MRRIRRLKFTPHTRSLPRSKRSVLNGIRISADQPPASRRVATVHTASQLVLTSRPSLAICVSAFAPAALVTNTNPLRRSAKVSRITSKVSCSPAAKILADVVDDDAGGIGVVADDADVERVAIEGEADFGQLGRRLSFVRLGLEESAAGRRGRHTVFVERAVERDWRARFDRGDGTAAIGRLE